MKKSIFVLTALILNHLCLNAEESYFVEKEWQDLINHYKTSIGTSVDQIIEIPTELKNYENTLLAWVSLREEIWNSLLGLEQIHPNLNPEYRIFFQDYLSYVQLRFCDNIELNNTLVSLILNDINFDALSEIETSLVVDVFNFCISRQEKVIHASEFIILCGEIEVSGKADTKGNSSAEISVRSESDDGRFKGEVVGTIDRDNQGNTTGTVEARGTYSW